ncbi:MAG: adenosine deaminase [Pseudomonadota bacterium]
MRHGKPTAALIGISLMASVACTAVPQADENFPREWSSNEARVSALFDTISDDRAFLRLFLSEMPKGGDLHNHMSGTPYAEEYLEWAAEREFCIDTAALAIRPPPCAAPDMVPVSGLIESDIALYERVVDAMSVRALLADKPSPENGHTQFFSSFDRFLSIYSVEPGKALASSKRSASYDHVLYQELMYNPASMNSYALGLTSEHWTGEFASAFETFKSEIPSLVAELRAQADRTEADAHETLTCAANPVAPGCEVATKFNCYGFRLLPEAQLFHQLALCFALIEADPRFLGVSLVQPEDHPLAIKNYDRHMQMIAFLNEKFPRANVSLHAGELTLGLVPDSALRSHVAKAIHVAGSKRIGHGVDIAYEKNSRATLKHMSDHEIAVEINLSSNSVILGVEGSDHPLNLYLESDVPIVLSTDDLGVLRSDMTEQYVVAASEHGLSYKDLKQASRNSLYYSFLPGESLWQDRRFAARVDACSDVNSALCDAFTANSSKALLEQALERAFTAFEREILTSAQNQK